MGRGEVKGGGENVSMYPRSHSYKSSLSSFSGRTKYPNTFIREERERERGMRNEVLSWNEVERGI